MMEASALINTDFAKAQAAAQRAIDKASAQGSHVLVARDLRNSLPAGSVDRRISRGGHFANAQIALQSSIAARRHQR